MAEPLNVRLSEEQLANAYGVVLSPVPEVVAMLDALAREVAVCRELCELLVDWAGARDRVPADTVITNVGPDMQGDAHRLAREHARRVAGLPADEGPDDAA